MKLVEVSTTFDVFQIQENKVVCILSAYAMRRSDKQADRVEISPEQLSAAAIEAEVGSIIMKGLRVYSI